MGPLAGTLMIYIYKERNCAPSSHIVMIGKYYLPWYNFMVQRKTDQFLFIKDIVVVCIMKVCFSVGMFHSNPSMC